MLIVYNKAIILVKHIFYIHKDIFACLFSIHNIISLSCHEQVCLISLSWHDKLIIIFFIVYLKIHNDSFGWYHKTFLRFPECFSMFIKFKKNLFRLDHSFNDNEYLLKDWSKKLSMFLNRAFGQLIKKNSFQSNAQRGECHIMRDNWEIIGTTDDEKDK